MLFVGRISSASGNVKSQHGQAGQGSNPGQDSAEYGRPGRGWRDVLKFRAQLQRKEDAECLQYRGKSIPQSHRSPFSLHGRSSPQPTYAYEAGISGRLWDSSEVHWIRFKHVNSCTLKEWDKSVMTYPCLQMFSFFCPRTYGATSAQSFSHLQTISLFLSYR